MESTTSSPREREQRLLDIHDAAYVDLLRFVRRRVHPTHAEDVVGEVMLVAWRRLDDVPADLSAARAWLFGVARKTLQNARRREDKHDAVAVRLAEVRHGPADAGHHPDLITCRADVAAAWPLLSATDQEAIALSVLDELTGPEAAAVLAAAGDRAVMVHGASAAQSLLAADQLDEVEIHLVPVLLGAGRRLFERHDGDPVELELVRSIDCPLAGRGALLRRR